MTTDSVTLKPCPFCGGESAFGTVRYSDETIAEQNWGQDTFHSVNCIVCGTNNRGPVGYRTKELAAEAWNRRSSAEPQATREPKCEYRCDGGMLYGYGGVKRAKCPACTQASAVSERVSDELTQHFQRISADHARDLERGKKGGYGRTLADKDIGHLLNYIERLRHGSGELVEALEEGANALLSTADCSRGDKYEDYCRRHAATLRAHAARLSPEDGAGRNEKESVR